MAHSPKNPVVFELDSIAAELEKTGNADLATLVDEVSEEIISSPPRTAAKAKPAAKAAAKPGKAKTASTPAREKTTSSPSSKRARIAAAMRKIARAQVSELEDIASELIKEGDKKAALEVLKIAEDLDSEYEYSGGPKHKAPESKGDASKRFDKAKANKPDAKMDSEKKEHIETPFGDDAPGYPEGGKKAASKKDASFDDQLEALIRLAAEEDSSEMPALDAPADEAEEGAEMDMGEEGEEGAEESEEGEESEDADDADLEGLDLGEGDDSAEDGMDMGMDMGAEESEPEDELAAMMKAMEDESEPSDMEASSDRMYEAEDADEEAEEAEEASEEGAESAEEEAEEESAEDEAEDTDAGMMGALAGGAAGALMGGPMGALGGAAAGSSLQNTLTAKADKQKMLALAKKLSDRGEKKLAARVAKLAK